MNIGGVFVSNEHWFLRRAAGLEPNEEKKAWSPSRAREALRAELGTALRMNSTHAQALRLAVDSQHSACDAPALFVSFWKDDVPLTREAKEALDLAKELVKELGEQQEAALQCVKEARARAEMWEQEERRASRMAGGEAAANVARENAKMAREKEREAEEYAALFRRAIHGG